ncbi:hypothetical protein SPRG_04170 [Saprolegnia parasitica CBS 223.65]|uniref:Uncharacterized protein n=1 Tax=Saprolegnia parasitica (strain CBS 223.65) TaxID=695850 RepID=A0A067CVZ8_SAPPC|nr:hypothetical protein SPRG_04170 [Saprolegnia parasitica CBS 223.65]KDO30982.1 hypothetical protein SPRG_04170 [Saprolegnia parasitica CBS 223.65]|eukprot:XP_012198166.1 hypothetical protein SPRG_04170 [Saprolegnia parasitica CBS 223.65]
MAPNQAIAAAPLTWRRICFALFSYALFFTDIPRSGLGYETLPYPLYSQVTETIYSNWGPYDYKIIDIARDITGSLVASDGSATVSGATIWSYKHDTCSIGLRALVQHFQIPGWDPCLLYARACASDAVVNAASLFIMLDNVIATIAALDDDGASLRLQYMYNDVIRDTMSVTNAFMNRELRTVRAYHLASPSDLCDPHRRRKPSFCDKAWANFSSLAPRTSIQSVAKAIEARFAAKVATLDNAQQIADMVVLECAADFRPWVGGVAHTQPQDFDLVTFLRVRNCSTTCETVYIDDFRYEGSLFRTDVVYWYRLVRLLRLLGQMYNIVRTLMLFVGCYVASGHKLVAATRLFLSIPAQVIIYGSWLPVAVFAFAHAIDSAMVYCVVFRAFSTLNGGSNLSGTYVYFLMRTLTCHMRNLWVFSVLTKTLLYSSTPVRTQHLLGFRGYVLALISFLAIFFDVRLLLVRNTNVVTHTRIAPSQTVQLIRYQQTLPTNSRLWGLYLDATGLVFSFLILRAILRLFGVSRLREHTFVPYAATAYANTTLFSAAWSSLFVNLDDPVSVNAVIAPHWVLFPKLYQHVLINLVWMTDPIEFGSQYCRTAPVENQRVYVYLERASGDVFYHPWSLNELEDVVEDVSTYVHMLRLGRLWKLPWIDRIHCS